MVTRGSVQQTAIVIDIISEFMQLCSRCSSLPGCRNMYMAVDSGGLEIYIYIYTNENSLSNCSVAEYFLERLSREKLEVDG